MRTKHVTDCIGGAVTLDSAISVWVRATRRSFSLSVVILLCLLTITVLDFVRRPVR